MSYPPIENHGVIGDLHTVALVGMDGAIDSLGYRLGEEFSDGLSGREGTFSMCSFEKILGYANHLGLYGEQLGQRGKHLGNFPQAFTHLALISAAYDLDRRLSASGRSA